MVYISSWVDMLLRHWKLLYSVRAKINFFFDTSFICHWATSFSYWYVLQKGSRAKWVCSQCNPSLCSAVRGQFVKIISRVLNNNDSRLERMPVPQQLCDHWGMEHQRRRKVGHFPEITHTCTFSISEFIPEYTICLCSKGKIYLKIKSTMSSSTWS